MWQREEDERRAQTTIQEENGKVGKKEQSEAEGRRLDGLRGKVFHGASG